MLRILYLLLSITGVFCGQLTILDMAKTMKSFTVSGCDKNECPMYNGETKTLNITFVANQNSRTLVGRTWVFDNGTANLFTGFNPDGCAIDANNYITPPCPLRKGKTYSFIRIWTVEGVTPGTKPLVIGEYFGDRKEKPILYACTVYTITG